MPRLKGAALALAVGALAAAAGAGGLGCKARLPAAAAKAPVVRLPRGTGVTYVFQPLLGPVPSADRFKVVVTGWGFPAAVSIRWTGGLLPNQRDQKGERTLTTLMGGRRFEPVFADREDLRVTATAPWVSRLVYRRLAAGKRVSGFFEGGQSLSGQVTAGTTGIELVPAKARTYHVLTVDGATRRVKAIRVNDGAFVIADDSEDPLVLEYKTVGAGWRLIEVRTVRAHKG